MLDGDDSSCFARRLDWAGVAVPTCRTHLISPVLSILSIMSD